MRVFWAALITALFAVQPASRTVFANACMSGPGACGGGGCTVDSVTYPCCGDTGASNTRLIGGPCDPLNTCCASGCAAGYSLSAFGECWPVGPPPGPPSPPPPVPIPPPPPAPACFEEIQVQYSIGVAPGVKIGGQAGNLLSSGTGTVTVPMTDIKNAPLP
jgi:hypothetical protein